MNCPLCKAVNDDANSFCVNCGATISAAGPPSIQTQFSPRSGFEGMSSTVGDPRFSNESAGTTAKSGGWLGKFVIVFGGILILAVSAGFGAYYYYFRASPPITETLPEHLGMFYRDSERNSLTELRRIEAANIAEARRNLLSDNSIPVAGQQPEVIFYADVADLSAADLKLVSVDSIKDDGSMKQLDFQTFLIDGKPAMKRFRPPRALAIGKYAFVRADGYFDEGKHRLWAFEIRNAEKKENGDLAKDIVIALKPKQAAPPIAKPPATGLVPPKVVVNQPAGSRAAYCNSSNVVVRSSPSLTASKISGLRRGQRVYVLNYSNNTDYWRGMQANWAYVQTETGRTGWVFSPFISH